MATAQQVLKIAAGEIGYSRWDDPQQGTKYGRYYAKLTNSPYFGTNNVPYCAMYVTWVLDQAGQKCPGFPTASCGTALNGAKKAGKVISNKKNAKPGDIVIFNWGNGGSSTDHVGFVEKNCGTYIQTIEGNTSPGNSGSQGNGGGVYRRTRNWGVVNSVIRPDYDGASSGGGSSSGGSTPSGKITEDGYWGKSTTKLAQEQAGTEADSEVWGQNIEWKSKFKGCTSGWKWESTTKKITGSPLIKKIQATLHDKYGQDVGEEDGIVGRKFWRAIEAAAGYPKDEEGLEAPSNTIKWFQKKLNAKSFF